MDSFVEVETLYGSDSERNNGALSHVYLDRSRMREVIHRLITKRVGAKEIAGKSVFLKPNWVMHEAKETDYLCLRTNDNLMLCVLEEVLSLSPIKVMLGDAPVQGCEWNKMISEKFLSEISELSQRYKVPVVVKDFRRTINDVNNNKVSENLHPIDNYVIFDLGSESYLESITTRDNKFRVTCYNPDRMAEVHHKGTHKYCVVKDVFEYDVIIAIPKLKTHRMAGITNAMKLLVGVNGDKDYLPHHRVGSIKEGGDNYKDFNLLRSISNILMDNANRRRGSHAGLLLSRLGVALWKFSRPDKATLLNAGWYGNDTIWRTVMDLNSIVLYGDTSGVIHQEQQRQLYIIMDGIIGGQGDGPLHPVPSPLGIVAVANNPYLMDVVAGRLYHLEIDKIPILREALKKISNVNYSIIIDHKLAVLEDVARYGIDIEMSPGWEDYNK